MLSSKVYAEKGDYVAAAGEAGQAAATATAMLFKPTKATKGVPRHGRSAMSYAVGAEAMKNDKYKGEDAGFAIPAAAAGRRRVNNHQVELYGTVAHAMGDYIFTDATPATRCVSSTPSPTSAARTARCASACTTRRCRTWRRHQSALSSVSGSGWVAVAWVAVAVAVVAVAVVADDTSGSVVSR